MAGPCSFQALNRRRSARPKDALHPCKVLPGILLGHLDEETFEEPQRADDVALVVVIQARPVGDSYWHVRLGGTCRGPGAGD